MDFEFTEEDRAFRKEVEDFAKEELLPDWDQNAICWPAGYGTLPMFEAEFKHSWDQFFLKLGSKGWLSLGWPREYGGMASMMKQAIFNDVMSYYIAPPSDVATSIVGPTILHVASEEMKKEWLPKIARGQVRFWLGYSEPNAGSDLGSLQTRAEEDGDDLVINGQKVWSSGA
ncbi:MAG: acyl-CoA dehydrogenase family protein, partial [Desulfomonilaceae bacterium]